MPDVEIHCNCRVKQCVIDKGAVSPVGMVIGEDAEEDARRFRISERGIVLVTPEMLGQKLHQV